MVPPKPSTRPTDCEAAKALEAAGIHPLLSRLWAGRGVRNASETQLIWAAMIPPGQLTHVQQAAAVLADAIQARRKLLIVADYDCDGATARAVGLRALRGMGAGVGFLVPKDRTGVGEGKSVQERVDLGGSGILKKKK